MFFLILLYKTAILLYYIYLRYFYLYYRFINIYYKLQLCVLAASALPSTANSAVTGRFGTSGSGSSGSGGSGAKSVLGVKFGMLFGGDLDSGWGAGAFYHRKIGIISL